MVLRNRPWLVASILVAILFAASSWGLAFDSPYTVQDDARQHVFWLQRLNDRDLFVDDAIADYFSSIAPQGYKFVYWLADVFGIEPFLFNRILPVGLGVGTSVFIYLITLEILPIPLGGFFASLLLNQNFWLLDDLVSGTPRAFFGILFLGFIYFFLRQNLWFCSLFIALQGLFYPQVLLISTGILGLNLVSQKPKRYFYLIGISIAIAVIGIYKLLNVDGYEVISLDLAKRLPEFYLGGRSEFFLDSNLKFWLVGQRSGYFPREWQYFLLSCFGLLLPLLMRFPTKFPAVKRITPKLNIIGQIIIASSILYVLAHLMLFELHLPSRYSQNSWRIVMALLGGITLAIAIDKIGRYQPKIGPLAIAIASILLLYPTHAAQAYPQRLGYVTGEASQLYQFLQQQPKNVLIATLSKEGDFIPSLAQRSVLVAREYSIPYHWDYYQQLRQKIQDLISAQYSSDRAEIDRLIEKYQIDLWLLDKTAFDREYLTTNTWLNQFSIQTTAAITSLEKNRDFVLQQNSERCSVFQTKRINLLDARCLIDTNSRLSSSE